MNLVTPILCYQSIYGQKVKKFNLVQTHDFYFWLEGLANKLVLRK
jgi:hypothetical protein